MRSQPEPQGDEALIAKIDQEDGRAMIAAQDILATYLHVQDGGRTDTVAVGETFWREMAAGEHTRLEQGRLMTAFSFSEPWLMWERHPAGEELVLLLAGAATLVLEQAGEEVALALNTPGAFALVPPGVWHTARTAQPCTLLFLTPGAGTEHRPLGAPESRPA